MPNGKRKSSKGLSSYQQPRAPCDAQLKILLIGDAMVGKTCIIKRYVHCEFTGSTRTTIGVDFMSKVITVDDKQIELHVWDTAGQEKYRTLTKNYARDADGVFIVFGVDDINSFNNVSYWVSYMGQMNLSDVGVMLLANKCEDEKNRIVSNEMAEQYANKNSIVYMEVSAKTGNNIDEAFKRLALQVIERKNPSLLRMYRRSSNKGFAFDYAPVGTNGVLAVNVHNGKNVDGCENNESIEIVKEHKKRFKIKISKRKTQEAFNSCWKM